MEIRLVPSALGIHAPAAQVIAARVARIQAHATHEMAAHGTKSHATARHHQHVKHAHAIHHIASSSSHKTSQPKNLFSNFFKSIFGGL
jgi:hypothetical protein